MSLVNLKKKFLKENSIDWSKICDLKLAVSTKKGHQTERPTTWYNFVVQKEYLFLRNIYPYDDLKKSENVSSLEKYCKAFGFFLHVAVLLNKYYNERIRVEKLNDDIMKIFLHMTLDLKYISFSELYLSLNLQIQLIKVNII